MYAVRQFNSGRPHNMTTTKKQYEIYAVETHVKNRLYIILKILLTGKIPLMWSVSVDRKDKRLRISGKKVI